VSGKGVFPAERRVNDLPQAVDNDALCAERTDVGGEIGRVGCPSSGRAADPAIVAPPRRRQRR